MTEIDPKLIGRDIRVVWNDPGEEKAKVWRGRLTNVTDRFIELTNDGHTSYINKEYIVALMEWTGGRREPEEL